MELKLVVLELRKNLKKEFPKISVKSSKGFIKITWEDIELEKIKANVDETLKHLFSENEKLYINGIQLWKDYSLEFKKNNKWMGLNRLYNYKFK